MNQGKLFPYSEYSQIYYYKFSGMVSDYQRLLAARRRCDSPNPANVAIECALMNTAKYDDGMWTCPVDGCGKRITQRSNLHRHIRVMHTKTAKVRSFATVQFYCS